MRPRACYHRVMTPIPLSLDTSPDVEQMQIDAWRAMAPEQKAATVTGLTRAVFALTVAGLRDRHPEASADELRARLAVLTLGRDLASRVCPDAATLDLS